MGRAIGLKRDIHRKTGDKSGYIYTYVPNHPKAFGENTHNPGYYYKHIVMAEKKLGRYLRDGETVKFKDGNRFNCSIDNVYVVDIIKPEPKYKKYIWVMLCYISENMYCTSTNIRHYLSEHYEIYGNYSEKSQINITYYALDKLRRMKFIKLDRIKTKVVGWYCTKEGYKEAKKCVQDGRSHKVVLDLVTNVIE